MSCTPLISITTAPDIKIETQFYYFINLITYILNINSTRVATKVLPKLLLIKLYLSMIASIFDLSLLFGFVL